MLGFIFQMQSLHKLHFVGMEVKVDMINPPDSYGAASYLPFLYEYKKRKLACHILYNCKEVCLIDFCGLRDSAY
jgi:hypothetical protein